MRDLHTAVLLLAAAAAGRAADSCVDCHSALDGKLGTPAQSRAADIHTRYGFSCADCHGGDKTSDDPEVSMNRAKGFRGKIARAAIPKLCGSCHSDAALIHRFKPQQRVDQLAQYRTSRHGKLLEAGDTAGANCVDCHSVHGIREVKDALSPVHPLRIAETCARCHADKAHMAKYGIPTDQFESYRRSVHWAAVSQRGDLSAPGCATCHGNHGATPPAVSSVTAVCGTCHVVFEQRFNGSPHREAFAAMGVGSCTTCHGNHEILKPTSALLAGPSAKCRDCHEQGSAGERAGTEMAALIASLEKTLHASDVTLQKARSYGMEVSEAQIRQIEARERLIRARLAVHAFSIKAVNEPVAEGLAMAAETQRAGAEALREKDRRRLGLAVSLVTILITMCGLGLAIRAVERRQPPFRRAVR